MKTFLLCHCTSDKRTRGKQREPIFTEFQSRRRQRVHRHFQSSASPDGSSCRDRPPPRGWRSPGRSRCALRTATRPCPSRTFSRCRSRPRQCYRDRRRDAPDRSGPRGWPAEKRARDNMPMRDRLIWSVGPTVWRGMELRCSAYLVGIVVTAGAGTTVRQVTLLVNVEPVLARGQPHDVDVDEHRLGAWRLRDGHVTANAGRTLQVNDRLPWLVLVGKKFKFKWLISKKNLRFFLWNKQF